MSRKMMTVIIIMAITAMKLAGWRKNKARGLFSRALFFK
jgi:hypothetical protein